LANRTLDGLEQLLADHFGSTHNQQRKNKVHLVRYADDFIITGTSEVLLKFEVQPLVEQFLKERGLELSHEKTRITHIEDGFDFLGQTIRRYDNGKVIIKPSKRNVKTFLSKIQETLDNSGSMTAGDVIWRLNQQIKGWTMYHRHVVSGRTFAAVDNRIFGMLRRWCRRRHRNKNWKWIKKKYFQRVGNYGWVFTGIVQDSKGKGWPIHLMKAGGVKICRWKKIRSKANPYDPEWEPYLEERAVWKWNQTLAGRGRIDYLWKEQGGKCVVCGQNLHVEEDPWHVHHRVWRCQGGRDTFDNLELLHANCHRQVHARTSN
jgi:RNA-directed DNA polymerase